MNFKEEKKKNIIRTIEENFMNDKKKLLITNKSIKFEQCIYAH